MTYTYDEIQGAATCQLGKGYLCQRTDESGNYQYNYDIYDNVLTMHYTEQETIRQYSTAYRYDNGDNITQTTYPSNRVVTS